jgi:putative phosphoribosyl transferase
LEFDKMTQSITEQAVKIPPLGMAGDLVLPPSPAGIVLFAHGSGSSRHSPRNRSVAGVLQEGGFGTLLLDLLTEAEEQVDLRTRHLRFDIELLAGRLGDAADWLERNLSARRLRMGYFGASTGAGAALTAAAEKPAMVDAIVSRGGRPDLAGIALRRVKAPTLLIVGGEDHQVIELNRQALAQLQCEKELSIVPGATHLFEEPGKLGEVSNLALDWFRRHLGQSDESRLT